MKRDREKNIDIHIKYKNTVGIAENDEGKTKNKIIKEGRMKGKEEIIGRRTRVYEKKRKRIK